MDFYLGRSVVKTDEKKEIKAAKTDATDEVLIMLFSTLDLKKLIAKLLINCLLKVTMNLSWSDFVSLSLMIIMMRHPMIRFAYNLFVGYLVDEVAIAVLVCFFEFYEEPIQFTGEHTLFNTTFYYLNTSYGTLMGIFNSLVFYFACLFMDIQVPVTRVFKQITLCIFLYFIRVLNYKKKKHPTDIIFEQSSRKLLYKDSKKLDLTIKEYCRIIDSATALRKNNLEGTKIKNIDLLFNIRALYVLLSKAEYEDLDSNVSQHFILCMTTFFKAYLNLVPRITPNVIGTQWKAEVRSDSKGPIYLDDSKCKVIEGTFY
eukprot:NODE_413_length_7912_cov_0.917061.p3 type:complete len:315 gc:universal NODE_413_length_7912_cov_0.917061:2391-3335(+)